MRRYRNWILTGIAFLFFILFLVLVRTFDVAPIGPEESSVGFAGLNAVFAAHFPFNASLYKLTEYLGYAALLVAAGFAVAGFVDLFRKRSLKKLAPEFFALAGIYALVIFFYVFFDKVAVNFRPVLLEETLEPSFPSTHTLLAVTILSTAMIAFSRLVKNKLLARIFCVLASLLMLAIVVGRALSGVHWLTDIVGGLLLSGALVILYISLLERNPPR